jgi:hypothetical protein
MSVSSAWSLRNLYLYLVCLITLVIVIFASVNLVRAVVELAYPDPGYYITVPVSPDGKPTADRADLEMQQKYQIQQAIRSSVLSLVSSGMLLLVAEPLWI